MLNYGNGPGCKSSTLFSFTAIALVSLIVAGCGGGSQPSKQQQAAEPNPKPAAKQDRVAAADHAEKAPARKSKTDEIPYDAYFDNPLEVAATQGTVATPAVASNDGAATTTEKPTGDTAKPAAGGSAAWSDYLPIEDLQVEMKKVQNHLKACMQGPGTYNGTYKDISVDGSVIAALAQIAVDHSGDVPWKANAPMIRDVGFELANAATGLGKENYEKTKTAYEKLDSIFSGAIPADVKNAVPKRPFDETASREGLMKRIEKARNHLRDNINVEAKLKAESDSVLHETLMIATLGKIVSMEGYSSTDEDDYQKFAKALIEGAKEASAAAKDQSFQKFTDSMNKVNKSCDQCHANYGNG